MIIPNRLSPGLWATALLALTLTGCNVTNSPSGLKATQLSMTPEGIKTFHFSWPAVAGADHYKLLETRADTLNPIVHGELSQTDADASNLLHKRLTVALYDQTSSRYFVQSCNAADKCVDGPVFFIDGTATLNHLVDAIGYIKASNTGEEDKFGTAISLNQDGTVMAIGVPNEDSGDVGIAKDKTGADQTTAENSGAVYLFTKNADGQWEQQAYIKANNTGENDQFGNSVGLNGEGTLLAVGAIGEDSPDTGVNTEQKTDDSPKGENSGAVYLFERDENAPAGWTQKAYIKAWNPRKFYGFGNSISLSRDGTLLAVGSKAENNDTKGIRAVPPAVDNGNSANSGAVYLFERDKTATAGWKPQAYVKANNTGTGDSFGASVSLNQDGTVLAVGAINEDSSDTGVHASQQKDDDENHKNSGAVYLFERDGNPADTATAGWTQQAYVKASNTEKGDQFGNSVSLDAVGKLLAVGAYFEGSADTGIATSKTGEDENTLIYSGAVYMFRKDETVGWQQQAYIKASNTGVADKFGSSVSLSDDGRRLAVAATDERCSATGLNGVDNNEAIFSGAAYNYVYYNNQWHVESYIKASNTGASDYFGLGLALSGDGQTLAVGASEEDSNGKGVGGYDLDEGEAAHGEDYNPQVDNSMENAGAVYLY